MLIFLSVVHCVLMLSGKPFNKYTNIRLSFHLLVKKLDHFQVSGITMMLIRILIHDFMDEYLAYWFG